MALKELRANDNKFVGGGNKANDKNLSKKLKNVKSGILMHMNIRTIGEPTFLTLSARKTFN